MNQPQVSIFPAEMTTALYRRAIASAWRQKTLTETGCDQYGPHSLTVERIEMAIALHIECALIICCPPPMASCRQTFARQR